VKENEPINLWVMSAEYEPYIRGGLGTVATHLTRELADTGMKVTVLTAVPSNSARVIKRDNLTVLRLPKHFSTSRIAQFITRSGICLPEVILIHSLEYVPLLKYYKEVTGVPAIYTCHSLVL